MIHVNHRSFKCARCVWSPDAATDIEAEQQIRAHIQSHDESARVAAVPRDNRGSVMNINLNGGITGVCDFCRKPGFVYHNADGWNLSMCDACRDGSVEDRERKIAERDASSSDKAADVCDATKIGDARTLSASPLSVEPNPVDSRSATSDAGAAPGIRSLAPPALKAYVQHKRNCCREVALLVCGSDGEIGATQCTCGLDALLAGEASPSLPSRAWQPMETAPKDGTPILVYVLGGAQYVVWWQMGDWVFFEKRGGQYSVAEPTHWMPLPAAPSLPSAPPVREEQEEKNSARGDTKGSQ